MMISTISVALSSDEFCRRLSQHTLKDCYQSVSQNKFRGSFYSDMRSDLFHLYYRPAHSKNLFRTYLRGRFIQSDDGRNQIVYWYSKENVTLIRSVIMAVNFLYAAFLLRTAAPLIAAAFTALGVLSVAGAFIHLPQTKKRLRAELDTVLEQEAPGISPETPAEAPTP